MSLTLTATQKLPFALYEQDVDGDLVADPGDSAVLTVDATSPATIAMDAAVDPTKLPSTDTNPGDYLATGFLVATKAGTINYTITYAHTDGTPAPPAVTGSITILPGEPVTGGAAFGTPVSQ